MAGLRAAETFRSQGYEGPLTVIGAESHLPYDRPPLSKKLLLGEWEADRIELRKPDAYDSLGLSFRLGRRARSLDVASQTVQLDDGEPIGYSALVIATGANCRRLPGQPELDGIFTLRTLDDALALRAALRNGTPNVVVIGAGFIGAEVASTARGLGCNVTIVEALAVPLVRGLGEQMGHACAAVHADHGVQIRLGVGVERIAGSQRVEKVYLADGTVLDADVVVVGIGVVPSTDWLEGSGMELRDGVVCDASLRTGAPACTPLVTSLAGPTRSMAKRCASSTGPTPVNRGRSPPRTPWPSNEAMNCSRTLPCRSFGVTSTTGASSFSVGRHPAMQ